MSRRILRSLSMLVVVAFAAAACEQHPTEVPLGTGEASLALYANVGEADVAELAIEVTAPDLTTPLVFNLTVQDGVASGSLRLPAGSDRLITVRGFSSTAEVTHHGEATVSVREGENPPVSITLVPLAGDQPIEVRFGTRIVVVHPNNLYMQVGDDAQMWAEVLNGNGEFITEEVRWASSNPARATVDEHGYVVAKRTGAVEIVATYEGTAGSAQLHVSGTDGRENNTTQVVDFAITPLQVDVTGTSSTVEFIAVLRDTEHGVQSFDVTLRNPSYSIHRYCASWDVAEGDVHEGTWRCTVEVPADSEPGEWKISSLGAENYSSGWTYFNNEDLADGGFPSSVTVVSDNPDTEAPELTDLSVSPLSVHLSDAEEEVEVLVDLIASDVGTGITDIYVQFWNPEAGRSSGCGIGYGPNPQTEVTESCTAHFYDWHLSGEYRIAVDLMDAAGNWVYLDHEELAARGLPSVLTVTRWDDE
jgi:hypothetical protein